MATDMRRLRNHQLGLNTSADVEPAELDISEYQEFFNALFRDGKCRDFTSQLSQITMNYLRNRIQKEARRMAEDWPLMFLLISAFIFKMFRRTAPMLR